MFFFGLVFFKIFLKSIKIEFKKFYGIMPYYIYSIMYFIINMICKGSVLMPYYIVFNNSMKRRSMTTHYISKQYII